MPLRPFLIAAAIAMMAGAAPAEDRRAAVEAAIHRVTAEWRVVLTCSATEPETHDLLLGQWREALSETEALLPHLGWTEAELRRLAADADPGRMIPQDLPYGQVIALCRFNADWAKRLRFMKIPYLDTEIRKAAGLD